MPIRHLDELKAIGDEWVEVYENSLPKSPFLSLEFVSHWYACFAKPNEIRIYRANNGAETIGFLPLVMVRKNFLRELRSLTNDHCLQAGPLVKTNCESEFLELILKELLADKKSWDLLRYDFSYSFCQFEGLFPDDLLKRGGFVWNRAVQPTYVVSLDRSFNDYFQRDLSDKIRKNIKMYRNRLAKEESYSIQRYRGNEAIEVWPEFLRIEDSGWKGDASSSITRSGDEFKRYYEGFITLLANDNALSIYLLRVGEKAVAGVFGYTEGETFHYFKIGYDEEFKAFSPSNLLMIFIIEELINEAPQIKRFHMFPWDHGYKHRFVNCQATSMNTIIYGKTARGSIALFHSKLKDEIKKIPGGAAGLQNVRKVLHRTVGM